MAKIIDKKIISKKKFCPPHYIPHKLPLGKKIIDEPCHIHKKVHNMIHHKFFCKCLKCSHYNFMIKELGKAKNV
ncbi:hypothetical protein HYT26_00155 [Candidatus Pacearchaeota archaeon]|nr:hypothetical protein [Candidatus Pacearchaeota archaeon]